MVDTPQALDAALDEWSREPALGMDTESNSFFAYRERTCLLQVSSRDADWIVDPFAVDLTPMAPLFADPSIEKIFHASELDVVSLRRDYGIQMNGLFDTLVAAKAVGRRKVGLASLVEESLGINLSKDEQRSDWGRRPLTAKQLEYAYADTRWLLALTDLLKQEVALKQVEEEVRVDCLRMAQKSARPRVVDPEAFEKHPSARKLDPVARQLLRSLYLMREQRAAELDRPLFKVVSDQTLGDIAVRQPRTREELAKVPGVTPPLLQRHGDALIAALEEGFAAGPLPFKRKPYTAPDPLEEVRFEALRAWRRKVAEARGVEVEVIAGNALLKALAKANPKSAAELEPVEELDAYRRARYGAALLGTLDAAGRTPAP